MVDKKFIFEVFFKLKQKNIFFTWSAQSSINVLNKYSLDELDQLNKLGCSNISFGIESGDDYILKKITHNKTSINKSLEMLKRLKDAHILPSVTSIIGFPYNKGRDFNKTLKLLMRIKLNFPELSLYCTVFQPIPESESYKDIFPYKEFAKSILNNNYWTSNKQKKTLVKYEKVYFTFCNRNFYKSLPDEIVQKIKWYNIILYPFIKLRFIFGFTTFLWEYSIVSKRINLLQKQNKSQENLEMSQFGVRQHNTNYSFGYKNNKNE